MRALALVVLVCGCSQNNAQNNVEPDPLPGTAPVLQEGIWTDLTPTNLGIPWGTSNGFTQGMAIDPKTPATLYLAVCGFDITAAGLFKSSDAGTSWRRVAKVTTNADHLDEPIRVRVDPRNPQHLYVGDGVRGASGGFWVSWDGGETFTQPPAFVALEKQEGMFPFDVYDVAPDPSDFNHVLVAHHAAWGWTDTKWNTSSGILESKDGGDSWIVHPPRDGWGSGHAINFLYNPELGIGDSSSWLLGTQGAGMWRTTDAGNNWTKVSELGIQHGGGSVYYAHSGTLFSSGANQNLKSTDNGQSWTAVGPSKGFNAIAGDGTRLYALQGFGPASFITSSETDGTTWTAFSTQEFKDGSFEIQLDKANRILYSATWGSGIWAMKVAP